MAPTVLWGQGEEWSTRDRLLVVALELYEQSLCAGCGQSSYLAHDPDYAGHFRVETVECLGCKAADNWRDSAAGKRSEKAKGVRPYLVMKLHNPNGGDDG